MSQESVYFTLRKTKEGNVVVEVQALHYRGLSVNSDPGVAFRNATEQAVRSVEADLFRLQGALSDLKGLMLS